MKNSFYCLVVKRQLNSAQRLFATIFEKKNKRWMAGIKLSPRFSILMTENSMKS